jgi:hypothetical protein
MNVDQQVDHDNRLVIFTVTGSLTDDGLLGIADTLESNPAIGKEFGWLIDLRMSDGVRVTTQGVRQMASRHMALSTASRRAVVVPLGLGYAAKQIYQMLNREGAPRVFADYGQAYRWVTTGVD